jgi:hypothetical protein
METRDKAEILTDALTTLRHQADADGVDYYAADRMAYQHYLNERRDRKNIPIPDGELIEYDQYFDRCEAANRTPLTFTQWQKAKAW